MDSEKLVRIPTEAFNERSLAGLAAGIVKDGQLKWFGSRRNTLKARAAPMDQ